MEQPASESADLSLGVEGLSNVALIEQKRKLLRRFYEPLILLEALRRAACTPKKPADIAGPPSNPISEWRRSFVDGIAYLCACERFSDCVTAVALERTPQNLVLWLAANDGVGKPTLVFLEILLKKIHHVARQSTAQDRLNTADQITPNLLRLVVDYNVPRLRKYVNNIRNLDLTVCINTMLQNRSEEVVSPLPELCRWLKGTFMGEGDVVGQTQSLFDLVLDCYLRRKRGVFESFRQFTGQGERHATEFNRLSMLLDKLGKHVTTVRKVVEAAVHLSDDFHEPIGIATLRPSPKKPFPLTPRDGTVESILGRAFPSSSEAENFKVRLQSLWNSEEIGDILSKERPRTTRVHAELLLAEHFYRNNLQFLDGGDRYIGCSKPTCYLCDAYLRSHPGGFAVPPSHQKIYLPWRCPDIPKDVPNSHRIYEEQERLWLDLITWVRKDLKREVDSRTPRAAIPPDSTAGVTSENHPVFGPFEFSRLMSLLHMGDESHRQSIESPGTSKKLSEKERETDSDPDNDSGGVNLF